MTCIFNHRVAINHITFFSTDWAPPASHENVFFIYSSPTEWQTQQRDLPTTAKGYCITVCRHSTTDNRSNYGFVEKQVFIANSRSRNRYDAMVVYLAKNRSKLSTVVTFFLWICFVNAIFNHSRSIALRRGARQLTRTAWEAEAQEPHGHHIKTVR